MLEPHKISPLEQKVAATTSVQAISFNPARRHRPPLRSPQPFQIDDVLNVRTLHAHDPSPNTPASLNPLLPPVLPESVLSRVSAPVAHTEDARVFPQWLKKEAFWLAFGVSGGVSAASAAMDLAVQGIVYDSEFQAAAGGALAVFGAASCFVSTWAATADIGQITGRSRRRLFLSISVAALVGVCVGHALHRWSENGAHATANMTSVIPIMLSLGMLSVVVPEVFACSELNRGQVLPPSFKREQIRRATIAASIGTLNAWATVDASARYARVVRIPIIAVTTTALLLAEGITRADYLQRNARCGSGWLRQTSTSGRRSAIPLTTALCAAGGKLVTAMSAASLVSSLRHRNRVVEGLSASGVVVGMIAAIYAAWRFGNDVARAGRPDAVRLKSASIAAAFLVGGGTVGQRYLSETHNVTGERVIILPIFAAIATICYVLPEFFARSESVHGFAISSPAARERFRRSAVAVGIAVNATWAHLSHNLDYPRALTPPLLAAATTILLLGEAVGRSNAVAFEAMGRPDENNVALEELAA